MRPEKVSWNSVILREQILQTDIVHKQLPKHLFAPNGGYYWIWGAPEQTASVVSPNLNGWT